jgi:hypothetical protein
MTSCIQYHQQLLAACECLGSLGGAVSLQPLAIIRLVELGGLALFAGFVITFLIAMKKLIKT